ncbi:PC4/YdbC family ssDNA-binding protein [Methylobacterium sp. J-090]|uniref:PC4/YdbC family ssDNA-binding protein n=1 Tax=Methylobacterium sp. J-090 TaxID=2836666 RepID=UPI001FB967F6|nr:PC4/YdbC family ssDNA-binding protein [Methylobacterium sp. J-090]MCJ2080157.1 transcriptional coactivator p15/PC4 family protein [Methylobacterium sp. J-090]
MIASRTVATIHKNNLEEIRVGLIERGGFAMVDMRVFAVSHHAHDEPRPTKNGICIPHTQLTRLIEALQIAQREASR